MASFDYRLAATVSERSKQGRVIWAISASVACTDGSFLFATAGGTRVVLYAALAAGGIGILEVGIGDK